MKLLAPTISCLSFLCLANWSIAQDTMFRPLFNGENLDGWVRVTTDESTWSIKDHMLVCTGKPTGELRTTQMYQNFILELEWRHMKPRGNAGIFVWADDITAPGVPFHRSIEVQVLENAYGNTRGHTTHGDIFPIHGATMLPVNGRGSSRAFPIEHRSKPAPEWNHYRIECRDGDISLSVNGKVVTQGKRCSPRKGYICVESEGGIVHYRNMRIQVLPDTVIDPQHIAIADRGYRCLYTGIHLEQWTVNGNWNTQDWQLQYAATVAGSLTTHEKFDDVGFLFDFRMGDKRAPLSFRIGGARATVDVADKKWHRVEGECRQGAISYKIDGRPQVANGNAASDSHGPLVLEPTQPTDFANIYVRDLNLAPNK